MCAVDVHLDRTPSSKTWAFSSLRCHLFRRLSSKPPTTVSVVSASIGMSPGFPTWPMMAAEAGFERATGDVRVCMCVCVSVCFKWIHNINPTTYGAWIDNMSNLLSHVKMVVETKNEKPPSCSRVCRNPLVPGDLARLLLLSVAVVVLRMGIFLDFGPAVHQPPIKPQKCHLEKQVSEKLSTGRSTEKHIIPIQPCSNSRKVIYT